MMVVGDMWEVHVPSKLAYGERGHGRDIQPFENLIYVMELVDMKPNWKSKDSPAKNQGDEEGADL
jgi:hypothetical protein